MVMLPSGWRIISKAEREKLSNAELAFQQGLGLDGLKAII